MCESVYEGVQVSFDTSSYHCEIYLLLERLMRKGNARCTRIKMLIMRLNLIYHKIERKMLLPSHLESSPPLLHSVLLIKH